MLLVAATERHAVLLMLGKGEVLFKKLRRKIERKSRFSLTSKDIRLYSAGMSRPRGLISQINSLVGSITHWSFRLLLRAIFNALGIEVSQGVERWLAYVLTGAFLI